MGRRTNGTSLTLSMIEYCLAKKKKKENNLAFSLKLATNLFSWKTGGIQGIFLLLWKDLVLTNMLWDSWMDELILFNKREYLCLDASTETPSRLWGIDNVQSADCPCYHF